VRQTSNGGMGVIILVLVALGAGWVFGQGAPPSMGGTPRNSPGPDGGAGAGAGYYSNANGSANGHAPGGSANGSAHGAGPSAGAPPRPGSWQSRPQGTNQRPGASTASGAASGASSAWEKARQETKERKAREEAEKERQRTREKEAKERAEREARLAKERLERDTRLAAEKKKAELREKERLEREEKDKKEKLANISRPYAMSSAGGAGGEKTYPYVRNPPAPGTAPATQPTRSPSPTKPGSPSKKYQATAKSYQEDESYSYRPYDEPKRPKYASQPSTYAASSIAPTESTSRTSPPPSHRGPYSTKDPDKIVIKGVYLFNNAHMKLPTLQLISGVGSVTDGLVLRITTEGLFIDDDVRHIAQREWDVKAWTLKLVEVWCPQYDGARSGSSASSDSSSPAAANRGKARRLFSSGPTEKPPSGEELDALFDILAQDCRANCGRARSNAAFSARSQTGDLAGMHVLRASIRDQEGKKYLFVLQQEEAWKVAVGLQRLRKGTQVRALGVGGLSKSETGTILSNLGWV
jgi:hypothetical protein